VSIALYPMKRLFRLLPLCILIAFVESALCQEKFVPGEIVTLQGDTLTGLIDYNSWSGAPTKMLFKQSGEGDVKVLKPLDVKRVKVKNLEYVGGVVEIELSADALSGLDRNPNPTFTTDTVFLMSLIDGPKSLYYIVKEDKDLFYIRSGSTFELLVYKRYLKQEGDLEVIKEYNKYRGQLDQYFQDCGSINPKLRQTKYRKVDLKRLFGAYYQCVGQSFKKRESDPAALQISFIAGASYTTLKFQSDPAVDLIGDAIHTRSTDFTGGIGLDFIFNKIRETWSLNSELMYSSYSASGHHRIDIVEDYYKTLDTKISMSYFKMNNLLRYKYAVGRMSLFINAGVSNGFGMVNENSRVERTVILTFSKEDTGEALDGIRKYEFGYLIGLGAKLKNFSLEFRGEKNGLMTESASQQGRASRLQFYLGYRIR
jgi:hypothetical protein